MDREELNNILQQHCQWLAGDSDSRANLSRADLSGADLRWADLRWADLRWADLRWADLSGADLSGANLSRADLSEAIGLQNPIDWLEQHFEFSADGLIAYKIFGLHYSMPDTWKIEPRSIIEEVCNPLPTNDCASGVNVATLDWIKSNSNKDRVWRCLIRWPWLAGVVVPYNTDGKIRAARVELLEEIKL